MTDYYPTQLSPVSFSDGVLLTDTSDAPPTLSAALSRAARQGAENNLVFLERHGVVTIQSYGQLLEIASRVLFGLNQIGLLPQDKVIVLLEDNSSLLAVFWGCILGGFVPVIVEVPPVGQGFNPALEKLTNLWKFLSQPIIIIAEERGDLIASIGKRSAQNPQFSIFQDLIDHRPESIYHISQPDDVAFLTLSSGSTGRPKCIQLSHRNLLARARGANLLNRHQPDEIVLNWLPFDHVGSISDWHIRCLLLGCKTIYVQKELVLGRILNWLDLLAQFRVTHSWAPTFAYTLINDQLRQNGKQSWDLSSIRCLLTAGEMITFNVIQDCRQQLAVYGLEETAIRSAFGMAELASGVTYSQPEDGLLNFHQFSPRSLQKTSQLLGIEAPNQTNFADLGIPIPGIALRVVDGMNRALPEGDIGYLQVKGEAVFKGYYQHPEANQEVFTVDGWFQTGDLGFLTRGHLALIGRAKDRIILNGVNYSGHEIEAIVEQVEGVTVSYTAVCVVSDADGGSEKVAIFFNCDLTTDEELLKLIKAIRHQVSSQVGIYPDYLLPLPKSAIPKTTIGKIQRHQLKQRFEAGEFEQVIVRIDSLFVSPRLIHPAEIESQIATIWRTVLQRETVNPQKNFFELGGHSVLLVQIQYSLQEKLGYRLSIADLFRYPTIASLAKHISQRKEKKSPLTLRPAQRNTQSQDVAVIGMACRFPGADNPEQFWQNLCQGVESINFFSEAEILVSGIEPELVKKVNYVKASPIINNIENFDADFFGYSNKEAELLDPQQRLLLECAWESLENAGYNPLNYSGAIGFYAGAAMNTYLLNNIYPNRHRLDPNDSLQVISLDSLGGFQMMVTNDKDYLTTRVSYKLNLTGPSVNVQTACSTSLAAVHLACQSLLNGECDLVVAGGVSVQVPQKSGYLYQEDMILSPDGHCRAFDAQAKGTIFGNGVGLVVLKSLEAALKDGDRIYAVIKGSAMSNDGGNKVGYLAPNSEGQARAVASAILRAGIEAESISYVEAHGTATPLGDPIEVGGLTQAFRLTTEKIGYCALGSVKTNIGHLRITSGVAGFIKTVLALYHRQIPPSLHFEQPNPQIDLAHSPFYVNTRLLDWQASPTPRRAGVNSLGIGGTNVHVILEEAPLASAQKSTLCQPERPLHLLALSAKKAIALRELAYGYEDYFARHPGSSLADVCFTANVGRAHLPCRLAIVADSVEQVRDQLQAAASFPRKPRSQRLQIAFLFAGQGSQSLKMGQELYQTQPTFRKAIERCAEIVSPYLERSLLDVLYPQQEFELGLDENAYSQVALFAVEYALFELWKSWGIEPAAVMGHSLGEYVAACAAGVFSLEDGLKLVARRGELVQTQTQPGKMVAVRANETWLKTAIDPYQQTVAISAFNGSENLVLSGSEQSMDEIIALLQAQGVRTKPLSLVRGFHSPLIEPMLSDFGQVAQEIVYRSPQLALVSTLTGTWATQAIATPEYWCDHLRHPVRFADGLKALSQAGYNTFIECSPQPTLLVMGQSVLAEDEQLLWLPSLGSSPGSDWRQLLASLAELYSQGAEIDWQRFDQDYSRSRLGLPTYPFQRQRYWIEPPASVPALGDRPLLHPLLGQKIPSALSEILFQTSLSLETSPWLADHQVEQTPILPGAVYLEMARAAGEEVLKSAAIALEDVNIHQALRLNETLATVQVIIRRQETGATFAIYSLIPAREEDWTIHCSGKITLNSLALPLEHLNLDSLQARLTEQLTAENFYQQCRQGCLDYGASFQGIKQICFTEGEALGEIGFTEDLSEELSRYQLHPRLLDACFQVVLAAFPPRLKSATYVPTAMEKVIMYRPFQAILWSYAQLRPTPKQTDTPTADLQIWDQQGNLVAQIQGLTSRPIPKRALGKLAEEDEQSLLYAVEWRTQARTSTASISKKTGNWLILADETGIAEELAHLLRANHQDCQLIFSPAKISVASDQVNSNPSDAVQQAIIALGDSPLPLKGIIHLWSLNPSISTDLEDTIQQTCQSTLQLVQTLVAQRNQDLEGESPRLWLITRDTQTIGNLRPSLTHLADSTLWGLGKVIASEHPELNCVCIDLAAKTAADEVDELWAEICTLGQEQQIALREGIRYVPRLTRLLLKSQQFSRLTLTARGTLENLTWQRISRRQPRQGEVEILVRATGLNFRDVLNVLGMYPGDGEDLGLECTGEIGAIGEGVNHLKIGERVMGLALGSFSQSVTVNVEGVIPLPDALSFEEAATIPGAFLTAYYTLITLAKLQPGERVLIHAAAGGVGLAAVQIAQQIGAEVFATASVGKWEFLKRMGVKQIMNSRTLTFAPEIKTLTQGQGVDIVLNCLSGEFIAKSLSILSPKGRFVEIGKSEVWTQEQVAQIRPDVVYFDFDLLALARSQPDIIQSILQKLRAQFQEQRLHPLPYQVFPPEKVKEAFRCLQQAKHIGKVVVSRSSETVSSFVSDEGSYLVTGGLGELGALVAQWLVKKGVQFLILVGRNEPSPQVSSALQQLKSRGVKILTLKADISQRQEVSRVLERQAAEQFPPLRGIIHGAGVLEDGMLMGQGWEQFQRVIAPKALGAWHLHQLTQELSLDFFVLFSSAASLWGSPGQASYCVANTFLDTLAQARRGMGLPGLSINWGAWGQIGMAARQTSRRNISGMGEIEPQQGLILLEQLLSQDLSQVGVMQMDWSCQHSLSSPFFADLIPLDSQKPSENSAPELRRQLEAILPRERKDLLIAHVLAEVARVLGLQSPDALALNQGFSELGMDSLTSIELRNQLQMSLNCLLPSTLAFDYPTVNQLVDYLNGKLFPADGGNALTEAPFKREVEALQQLSEAEAEVLLMDELNNLHL